MKILNKKIGKIYDLYNQSLPKDKDKKIFSVVFFYLIKRDNIQESILMKFISIKNANNFEDLIPEINSIINRPDYIAIFDIKFKY